MRFNPCSPCCAANPWCLSPVLSGIIYVRENGLGGTNVNTLFSTSPQYSTSCYCLDGQGFLLYWRGQQNFYEGSIQANNCSGSSPVTARIQLNPQSGTFGS